MKVYTVRKLAKMAGVSVRTLHHYDEIGLLKRTKVLAEDMLKIRSSESFMTNIKPGLLISFARLWSIMLIQG